MQMEPTGSCDLVEEVGYLQEVEEETVKEEEVRRNK